MTSFTWLSMPRQLAAGSARPTALPSSATPNRMELLP